MGPKSKKTNKPPAPTPTSKTTASTRERTPEWPALHPLVPTPNLTLEPLLPSQILLIYNLFTSALCTRYTSFLTTLPFTTTPATKSRDLAVRVNDRFQIQDRAFAERLWSQTALKDLVLGYEHQAVWGDNKPGPPPEILGLNPNIRVYRYKSGQFFNQHYDDTNNLVWTTSDGKTVTAKTTWTLLIYLSICEGGETVFYPNATTFGGGEKKKTGGKGQDKQIEPIVVAPAIGLGLLHRHGDNCMLHEGREVTSGEKWVLRSDLVVRRV